jgi:chitin synthase
MQVEAFSLGDAVKRISAGEHQHHIPFAEFLSRYGSGEVVGTEGEERNVAEQILEANLTQWGGRDVVLGVTGVFLSEAAFETLELQSHGGKGSRTPLPTMPSQGSLDLKDSTDDLGRSTFGRSDSRLNLLDNAQTSDAIGKRPGTMFSEWGGVTTGGDMFSALPSQNHLSAAAMEKGLLSEVVDEVTTSATRKRWMFLVWMLTWYIPDFALRLLGPKKFKRKDVRTAWREKLAINYLIWLACAVSIFFIAFFSVLICPKQNVYSYVLGGLTDIDLPSYLRQCTIKHNQQHQPTSPSAGKYSIY